MDSCVYMHVHACELACVCICVSACILSINWTCAHTVISEKKGSMVVVELC